MLDPKLLRDEFEAIAEKLKTRGLPDSFRSWPELDCMRREMLQEVEALRAEKNSLNPEIAKRKRGKEDTSELIELLQQKSAREKELNDALATVEQQIRDIELLVPNIAHESVPIGIDEESNRVEKQCGEIGHFDFEPKPHWEIAEALGLVSFSKAATLSGARFGVYLGDGARLERALANFMLDMHRRAGYVEVFPPLLVRRETMIGSGQLPKFEADAFCTTGEAGEYFLIPTSEVALCNLHRDEILDVAQLPLRYTAHTPCFRAEAGSYGKDVRGLIRLHQFQKVELVQICHPERSFETLEELTRNAESVLEALELPYRRVTLSSGDMGIAAAKTYDLEVWLPSQNCYREISSCSNTTDFQARRTKTRFREQPKAKPQFVHMLNGSGLAVGRTMVAILENYQQADGSVRIPQALIPYLDGKDMLQSS